jgi:hypothetical protein
MPAARGIATTQSPRELAKQLYAVEHPMSREIVCGLTL